jgi:hypothetical protein
MSEKEAQSMQWGVGADRDDRGWMFYGEQEVTEQNWENLEAYTRTDRSDLEIDEPTLVGTLNRDWSSWYKENGGSNAGGEGSKVYESQKVGVDVSFAEGSIWYRNTDGEYVKDTPPNLGAYHKWTDGMSTENREGPKPGSESEAYLSANGGNYYWDEVNAWYDVK